MHSRSCPNCGAPIANNLYKCEYCDSVFANIEFDVGNGMKNLWYEHELYLAHITLAHQVQNDIIMTNLHLR